MLCVKGTDTGVCAFALTVKTAGPKRCVTTGSPLPENGVNSTSSEYVPATKEGSTRSICQAMFGLHLLKSRSHETRIALKSLPSSETPFPKLARMPDTSETRVPFASHQLLYPPLSKPKYKIEIVSPAVKLARGIGTEFWPTTEMDRKSTTALKPIDGQFWEHRPFSPNGKIGLCAETVLNGWTCAFTAEPPRGKTAHEKRMPDNRDLLNFTEAE